MKNRAIAISALLIAAALNPIHALAITNEEWIKIRSLSHELCVQVAKNARGIMAYRQDGEPMDGMIKMIRSQKNLDDTDKWMLSEAYGTKIFKTKDEQWRAAHALELTAFERCFVEQQKELNELKSKEYK